MIESVSTENRHASSTSVTVLLHLRPRPNAHISMPAASLSRPRLLAFQDVGARASASRFGLQETSAKQSLSTPFINRAYPPRRFAGFILQLQLLIAVICAMLVPQHAPTPRWHPAAVPMAGRF
jgi:hypothetical protein